MKNKQLCYIVLASVMFAFLSIQSAFAMNYGILYEGGSNLGDNVAIDDLLVDNLSPVIEKHDIITINARDNWKQGAIKINETLCKEVAYFTVTPDSLEKIPNIAIPSYTISEMDNPFGIEVTITGIDYDQGTVERDNANQKLSIAVGLDNGWIYGGWDIFKNKADCEAAVTNEIYYGENGRIQDINALNSTIGEKLFVNLQTKLTKNRKAFISNGIFSGLIDIDHAQSYMILNSDNYLNKNNTYAKSKEALQIAGWKQGDLTNMYREEDASTSRPSYIYSEYSSAQADGVIDIPEGADVFTRLTSATQTNGLNVIFGFGKPAGSTIDYFIQQFDIEYHSDSNGEIVEDAITEEKVIYDNHPSGSTSKAKEGFEFEHWIANVDVVLQDGTIIKAGEGLSSAQIKTVMVTQPVIFTAIHAESIRVPDTGVFTTEGGSGSSYLIGVFVAMIITVFSLFGYLYSRFSHTVKFKHN